MANPPIDLTELSEDQQLALQQYTSVTDQNLDAAVPLLQKCQWNAQIAITRFFDGDIDVVDPVAEAARAPPPQPSRRTEALIHTIPTRSRASRSGGLESAPRVVPTPTSQLIQRVPFPINLVLLPFNLAYTVLQRVFGAVGWFFPFLPRLLARFHSGRTSRPSRDAGRRPLSPRDTAARFVREFEEEYGVTHGTLPFHEGGYAQAFDVAKRDLRYLFVVLLSPEHDDNATFVRETLLSPEFAAWINTSSKNIIMWAGTVQDAEAYQVSSAYNVTRFPYTCLVVHTPSVSSTAMSKVSTTAGPIASQDLIAKMEIAMQQRNQELDGIRRQRQEQQVSRTLRQEQESAYERSLAQDREKARKKREETATAEKAEQEEREIAARKADEARKLAQWRRWRANKLHTEPVTSDSVRMSIRLLSGERVIRKFLPGADIEELYAFVECYEILDEQSEKESPQPEGYSHQYKFQLVLPMPREVFDVVKGGSIRAMVGRSGNLIVEKIEEEEEEGDDNDFKEDDE